MAFLEDRLAANKRFEFGSDDFDARTFSVVNMEGFESISKPFRFKLVLVSDDPDIDMKKMLKKACTLRIFSFDGKTAMPYHGVLAEFEQLHQANGYVFYQALLVPRLWRLSLYQISEVYLNEQTIPEILETVLKDGQLGTADYEKKLSGSYRQRSFVCQYQETHLDFLSRWMEKEGMYYFFDHDGTADKVVVVDDKNMHPAEAVKASYRPSDELDTGTTSDSVQSFICRQKPLPRQVVMQDFNYRKADTELKVSHNVSEDGFGDVMLYGENYRNRDEGKRYAKIRAEEIICGGEIFLGEATAVGLRSGHFMELAHHYRGKFNGKYLVTEIHHEGSQAGALLDGIKNPYSSKAGETAYRNTFQAIPAAVQFRAPRSTVKPHIAGTMSATIDAEGSGQYAELDEYGQYKVQLPFDRSDKAANKGSARVRMASPYAGQQHGMHFPLHKNAEVLLSFAGGDPDEPIILSAVPNSENSNMVNNRNSSQSVIHTGGGNRFQMEDKQGRESVSLSSPHKATFIRMGAPSVTATLPFSPSSLSLLASPPPPPPPQSPASIESLGDLNAIADDASVQQQTDGTRFTTTGGHSYDITHKNGYKYTYGSSSSVVCGSSSSVVRGNNDSEIVGDTNKLVRGNATTTNQGNLSTDNNGDVEVNNNGNVTTTNQQDVTTTTGGFVKTTVNGNALLLNNGHVMSRCLGTNNALFLGERSQLTMGSNTLANVGVLSLLNVAVVLEMNLALKCEVNYGLKSVVHALKDEKSTLSAFTAGLALYTAGLMAIA